MMHWLKIWQQYSDKYQRVGQYEKSRATTGPMLKSKIGPAEILMISAPLWLHVVTQDGKTSGILTWSVRSLCCSRRWCRWWRWWTEWCLIFPGVRWFLGPRWRPPAAGLQQTCSREDKTCCFYIRNVCASLSNPHLQQNIYSKTIASA